MQLAFLAFEVQSSPSVGQRNLLLLMAGVTILIAGLIIRHTFPVDAEYDLEIGAAGADLTTRGRKGRAGWGRLQWNCHTPQPPFSAHRQSVSH